MKFHKFATYCTEWPDVMPGDIVISPNHHYYDMVDYPTRDDQTKFVITQQKPLLVISRLDKWEDKEPFPENYSLFVVFSISRGFLITVMPRTSQKSTNGELGT